MDKQKVVCIHKGILCSLKEEGNFDTYNMDEPQGHYTKYNNPVTKGETLYDSTGMRYLKQSSS